MTARSSRSHEEHVQRHLAQRTPGTSAAAHMEALIEFMEEHEHRLLPLADLEEALDVVRSQILEWLVITEPLS